MTLLLVDMNTCTYRFDLKRHLREVYHSRYREIFREFNSLTEFEECFYRQSLDLVTDELHRYFARGYNYLECQSREGFTDFTYDDENINFNHVGFSEVKRYLMANALSHLYASMALSLMDDTDIEDHLSPDYILEYMDPWFMTFSYRTY